MFGRSPELIAARVKLEFLEKENASLREQVLKLQEALVAKTSPQAYLDQRADRLDKEDQQPNNNLNEEINVIRQLLNDLEGRPAFSSPDEFIQYVKHIDPSLESSLEEAVTEAPPMLEPIHDNEEA